MPRPPDIAKAFSDGGGLRGSRTTVGCWACCWTDAEDQLIGKASGLVFAREIPGWAIRLIPDVTTRAMPDVDSVTTNQMEMIAAWRALRVMPRNWTGNLFLDSNVTRGRLTEGWRMNGIPDTWKRQIAIDLGRVGSNWRATLLKGHPTVSGEKPELPRGNMWGFAKDGRPVAFWNVWCDTECGRLLNVYCQSLKKYEGEVELAGSINYATA